MKVIVEAPGPPEQGLQVLFSNLDTEETHCKYVRESSICSQLSSSSIESLLNSSSVENDADSISSESDIFDNTQSSDSTDHENKLKVFTIILRLHFII